MSVRNSHVQMEIMQRMSKRFAWLLGAGILVSIGWLVACGSSFNSSSDGLVVVGSQGSGLLETFSFSLSSGHNSAISNSPNDTSAEVCVLKGLPSSIIMDPAGAHAFAIINQNSSCTGSVTGIQVFAVNSDGTITTSGAPLTLNQANGCGVIPVALAFDSSAKYLFIADTTTTCNGQLIPGTISVLAVGSGGTLTEVAGSPFAVPNVLNVQSPAQLVALAVTPTVFPAIGVNGVQNAVCSTPGLAPPTSEFLYVADKVNNVLWEYMVNQSTGALVSPPNQSNAASFPTGATPSGVAVDPCDRFVYVADLTVNQVSAYSICNGLPTQSSSICPSTPDDSLVAVTGSPFSITSGNGPGPIVVDPFGNFVYALDTLSSQISILKISPVSGSLTATGVTATGQGPTSMAIRGDDNWLFVTNNVSATLSQYSITPASGALTPQPAIGTDNLPWGVAVK